MQSTTAGFRSRHAFASLIAAGASVMVGAAAHSHPAHAATGWSVSSSIADGATLKGYPRWFATLSGNPPGGIDHIDFAVDGEVLWTEHNAPYYFNDDHFSFAAWLLGRGAHTLTVHALSVGGDDSTATAHVTVTAKPPTLPKALVGEIGRRVTAADVRRYSSPRPVEIKPGAYAIKLRHNGLFHGRSAAGGTWGTLSKATARTITFGPPAQWLGNGPNERGTICSPQHTSMTYRWKRVGRFLSFKAVGRDACPNRQAIVQGRWKHR